MDSAKRRGFTLIEILLVITIIGILASIAIPNSLKAQRRAKVARAQSDMRTMTLALEAYRVDNDRYPNPYTHSAYTGLAGVHQPPSIYFSGEQLTTPVAFINTVPFDPFDNAGKPYGDIDYNALDLGNDSEYCIGRYDYYAMSDGYVLGCNGPDGIAAPGIVVGLAGMGSRLQPGAEIRISSVVWTLYFDDWESDFAGRPEYFNHVPGLQYLYDPTNGSASSGGIYMPGP